MNLLSSVVFYHILHLWLNIFLFNFDNIHKYSLFLTIFYLQCFFYVLFLLKSQFNSKNKIKIRKHK